MKSKTPHPPRLPDHFLQWFCTEEVLETLQGDLYELYEKRREKKGKLRADLYYAFDVVSACRAFAFKKKKYRSNSNYTIMFQHYFKISWRSLLRKKGYSLTNLFSLAIGIGVCLAISQYIYFELSYDRFHDHYKNTYRIITEELGTESNATSPSTGWAFGEAARDEIPEIKQFVRKQRFNRGAIVVNPENRSVFHEEVNDLLFVDRSFFDVFSFPLRSGNQATLFNDKYSVVVTEETATRYFGSENPIGKTLKVNGPPSPGMYTVTGVLEDLPLNSHLQFDFLMPVENYIEDGWGGAVKKRGGWNGFSVETYLTIDPSADAETVRLKLDDLIARHRPEGEPNNNSRESVILQPVADIYLKSGIYSDPGFINNTGNVGDLKIFSVISFFILFISWINFINLSTSRSAHRSKEVGIRKSIGAQKKQLIGQFVVESFMINIFAGVLAIGLASALLPVLSNIVGKRIDFSLLQSPGFWALFAVTMVVGSLLSGLYPAFILSSFKPASIAMPKGAQGTGHINIRRGLIIFQFIISLLLVSGTYLVFKQTMYMKGQELNIDMENILVLRGQQGNINRDSVEANFRLFSNEMMRHHSISSVTSSTCTPGQFGVTPYRRYGQPESTTPYTRSIFASFDFTETYGLRFLAGGPFTQFMNEEEVAIINEAALQAFGFDSPESALQQKLTLGPRQREIVGVVENFNWHSVKESHTPYVISLTNVRMNPYISVKMDMSNIGESLGHIESTFHTFFRDQPFDYYFADDAFNRQYQSEVQFGKVFSSFSVLAIFVACIGLLAVVSYSASVRVKEIGIRKVLGAGVGSLMVLLTREYLGLLAIAVTLSFPIIIYLGSAWLENYAIRISLGLDLLLVPALILMAISVLTVSKQTYSAAISNPVDSLRSE